MAAGRSGTVTGLVVGAAAVLALAACSGGSAHPKASTPTSRAVSSAAPSTATTTAAATHPPTRSVASTTAVPPVSAVARAEGLIDVRSVVPDAVLDLRYATTHNFTGVQLYPSDARCLVHETMATGLRTAAAELRRKGYLLVFWDCYRPHAVQVRMFQVVPNPDWVARPGPYATSHESGRSVDVTLARAGAAACPAAQLVHGHCLVDMGTDFDDFTPRAHAFATTGVTAAERENRTLLRTAMEARGLTVYSGEWWHFDGPGSFVQRPILQARVD